MIMMIMMIMMFMMIMIDSGDPNVTNMIRAAIEIDCILNSSRGIEY